MSAKKIKPQNVRPVVSTNPGSTNEAYPHLDLSGVCPANNHSPCSSEQKAALANKLFTLSQLTWKQIQFDNREGIGHEKIPRSQIKVRLPTWVTPEVQTLICFRFGAKERLLGVRDNHVFRLAIVDRNHTAY